VAGSTTTGCLPTRFAVGGLQPAGSAHHGRKRGGASVLLAYGRRGKSEKRKREREMGNYLDVVVPPRVTLMPPGALAMDAAKSGNIDIFELPSQIA